MNLELIETTVDLIEMGAVLPRDIVKCLRSAIESTLRQQTPPAQRTEQEPLANELAQLKEEIALLKYKLWDCEEKSKPMQGQ